MEHARGVAAVVGTFDGVHRGHRFLLDSLRTLAYERGMSPRIYTFADHPLATIAPDRAPLMLSTLAEKEERLRQTGIDDIVISPFAQVRTLTARQYIEHIAKEGVRLLLVGYDNRFGSDGLRTLDQFINAASGLGVEILQAPELTDEHGIPINSTRARKFLESGDVTMAATILGYNYTLSGEVINGNHLGRTIGFPTANVAPYRHERKVLPGNGVYACEARVGEALFPGMVNIGSRPTVSGDMTRLSIEANIVGLDENIYGREVSLTFLKRLRDERQFPDLEALREQLEIDRLNTLSVYNSKRRE